MINDVVNGFSKAIHAEYQTAKIYREDVPQKLELPAFILNVISPSRDRMAANTVRSDVLVAVQYFPETGKEEIDDVADTLQEALEVIEVADGDSSTMRRTEQVDYAVVDNVLTIVFRASDILFSAPTGNVMEELQSTVRD